MPNIETPPALRGGTEQQLTQLHSYLYRLAENLNVSLQDSTAAELIAGQEKSPKAIFESIRPLISSSVDIQDAYYAEIARRLLEVFVQLEDYRADKQVLSSAIETNATDIEKLEDTADSILQALAGIRDRVNATEESESGGIRWKQRCWESGAIELWGKGSVSMTAGNAVTVSLPVEISGAAFVSPESGYAAGITVSGGVLSFTPSASGSGLSIYIRSF